MTRRTFDDDLWARAERRAQARGTTAIAVAARALQRYADFEEREEADGNGPRNKAEAREVLLLVGGPALVRLVQKSRREFVKDLNARVGDEIVKVPERGNALLPRDPVARRMALDQWLLQPNPESDDERHLRLHKAWNAAIVAEYGWDQVMHLKPLYWRVLARIIAFWSRVGWVLDTPFRLPYVWAVDVVGILTDEGRPNDYEEKP